MLKKNIKFKDMYVVPIDLPEFIRDKHNGELPVVIHEGKEMTGVLQIADYLEEKYPNVTMKINSTLTYNQVLEKTATVYPMLVKYITNKDPVLESTLAYEWDKQLDLIDELCRSTSGRYVSGFDLNMADYYLLAILHSAQIAMQHFKGKKMLQHELDPIRPALERWMDFMMKDEVFNDERVVIPTDTIVWGWKKLRGEVANPYKVIRMVKT